jgi:glycosyltransferase A (GT-A) superfamily protein (DUF2064 family)
MRTSTALIVFARAPQLGRVKTRLVPALGEQGALDLYRAMLRHTLQVADQFNADELILACTPDTHNCELRAMGHAVQATLQVQCGADLGARMLHALRASLQMHEIALLIGSDCPSLSSSDLEAARSRLVTQEGGERSEQNLSGCDTATHGTQMVFVPATDGGYVLVGATKPCAEIFYEMPWGSSEVMNVTRQRLHEKAVDWQELQAQTDIDRAEDLLMLPDYLRKILLLAPKF